MRFDRRAAAPVSPQEHAPVALIENRCARKPLDALFESLLGFVRIASVQLRGGQRDDRLRVVRIQFDSTRVKTLRIVHPAELEFDQPLQPVCAVRIRRDFQRFIRRSHRPSVQMLFQQHHAHVEIIRFVGTIGCDRLVQGRNCAFEVILLIETPTQQVINLARSMTRRRQTVQRRQALRKSFRSILGERQVVAELCGLRIRRRDRLKQRRSGLEIVQLRRHLSGQKHLLRFRRT